MQVHVTIPCFSFHVRFIIYGHKIQIQCRDPSVGIHHMHNVLYFLHCSWCLKPVAYHNKKTKKNIWGWHFNFKAQPQFQRWGPDPLYRTAGSLFYAPSPTHRVLCLLDFQLHRAHLAVKAQN